MIEIVPELDLTVIVQVLTLAFLCKNLDYKPQSINQSTEANVIIYKMLRNDVLSNQRRAAKNINISNLK